jgi:hypothetical protein
VQAKIKRDLLTLSQLNSFNRLIKATLVSTLSERRGRENERERMSKRQIKRKTDR